MFRKMLGVSLLLLTAGVFVLAQAPTGEELQAVRTQIPTYGPDGRLKSMLYSWPESGLWRDTFVDDDSRGRSVIMHFEKVGSESRLPDRFEDLGLASGVTPAPTHTEWQQVEGGLLRIMENGFARLETFLPADAQEPVGPEGRLDLRERTEVMGSSLTVERFELPDRAVTTDDYGGLRAERYEEFHLVAAADAHGPLVHVRLDSQGRIDRALLVGRYELRYAYDGLTSWTRKTVVDLATGRILAEITAQQDAPKRVRLGGVGSPVEPHERTTAHLADAAEGPIVAEWDSRSIEEGTAVAGLNGRPYALLPFEGGPPLARVLWFGDWGTPFLEERLDYSEDHARLWLQADQLNGFAGARTLVLDLTRLGQPVPENGWQDAPEGGGFPYLPGSNGGGSGGGGGGRTQRGTQPTGEMFADSEAARQDAIDRIEDTPACAALFHDLNRTDGASVLQLTTYRHWQESATCQGGTIPAWTTPNNLQVYLCDRFTALTRQRQTALLIHEALHSAGMLERNEAYPNAPTSAAIQNMVDDACGF